MKRFTDAGRKAIADGNLYAALSLALTLPDICASLEDPSPGKSRKRYEHWCNQWLVPKFTKKIGFPATEHIFITAAECYALRCSLIHSGEATIADLSSPAPRRFEFFDQTARSHMISVNLTVDGVNYGKITVLKAHEFSEEMFAAADEWDEAVKSDAAIQAEKAKLLVIRPSVELPGGGIIG